MKSICSYHGNAVLEARGVKASVVGPARRHPASHGRGTQLIGKVLSMHDIVIRGGTIIDGTGKAPFAGDLAIEGERIVGVGGRQGPARREIDATGLLVTPGWV